MLRITIPSTEFWDEVKQEFVYTKAQTLQLEHSLVSLSKWESRWNKPFLTKQEKTLEETIDYVKCMTLRAIDPSYFRTFGRNCCVGSRMSGRRCWYSRIFHWTFCSGSIWSGGSSVFGSGSIQYSQSDTIVVRIYRGRNPFSCWSNCKWRASYC